ncbi:unnamed protein product, partial [Adineta steineri]
DDFTSDSVLLIACIILQQQIIHINGNKETIITPNILLIKIYFRFILETLTNEQSNLSSSMVSVEGLFTENQFNTKDITISKTLIPSKEKRLACIPCGHLVTCVSRGHSLRICQICRREINDFVRIYI